MAAAGSVSTAQDTAEQARIEVRKAETKLAAGGSVGFEALHRLRDRWRHADLAAQGAQARAESERTQARLDGLTAVGAEVDKVAASTAANTLAKALEGVATACARVRALADEHDVQVAALVAAAVDLQVEAKAPGGPRATSGHVAVEGRSVQHKAMVLVPVLDRVEQALQFAVAGDVQRAAHLVRPVVEAPAPRRPDHLLRGNNGVLHPIEGDLNSGMQAHIRSGTLEPLSEVDIDRWMAGELA
ncbi:hypothetical protein P3T35_003038 [Kitasatospora sp. GP30]|uniref:hypothetical protein n=1 Tax=Kitasatospora sp. GP30 TaxID=3035084 RepID=UPI000C71443B|nr:hypothetical protein [Kitasatospora sp. GP30]MDH6141025.1 hypothetical protein [Kitasatospora sp. GP30]